MTVREAIAVRGPAELSRILPSRRSLWVAAAVVALGGAAYAVARQSSVFAIREIDVTRAPPSIRRDVREALAPLAGDSLLRLRSGEVERLATALPRVASVSYDRAFPNTLRVTVTPEVPLAVVRQGSSAWLVSRRGRVMQGLHRRARARLPRIWLPQTVHIRLGGMLAAVGRGDEVAALGPLEAAGLVGRVATVHIDRSQITYTLRGGIELRAGTRSRLPLKLEIAHRILASAPVAGYLDVSVPERPVAGDNSQLSG